VSYIYADEELKAVSKRWHFHPLVEASGSSSSELDAESASSSSKKKLAPARAYETIEEAKEAAVYDGNEMLHWSLNQATAPKEFKGMNYVRGVVIVHEDDNAVWLDLFVAGTSKSALD
jgi:hypothetical protein